MEFSGWAGYAFSNSCAILRSDASSTGPLDRALIGSPEITLRCVLNSTLAILLSCFQRRRASCPASVRNIRSKDYSASGKRLHRQGNSALSAQGRSLDLTGRPWAALLGCIFLMLVPLHPSDACLLNSSLSNRAPKHAILQA